MKAKDFGAPKELWNENVAICKRCGKPICFAKDEGGKWAILEPNFRSFHQCSHIKEVDTPEFIQGRKAASELQVSKSGKP